MFGTLLGGLPRPVLPGESTKPDPDPVELAIRAQEAAGLEPLTDGRLGFADPFAGEVAAWLEWREPLTVDAWRRASGLTERAVKQSLPGPYSLSRDLPGGARARERACLRMAEALHAEVAALAAAGCPLVEIEETQAHRIGDAPTERALFVTAHDRLIDEIAGTHLSLSIVGGSAWEAGPATILDPPYQSLAVDLIAGPDNWRIVAVTPGDRGIVAGALSPEPGSDDTPELLLFAARYAASTGGRGQARVGLAIAGSLAPWSWEHAQRKLERLARGVRLAGLPPGEELANSVDPRSINIRSAAYGRPMPNRPEAREGARAFRRGGPATRRRGG